jgi:UDP-N-acetylmuramoylalanine--D-glutamate ligase
MAYQPQDQNPIPISALIVGLAREGMALARFLAARGADVTVTDVKPAEALTENIQALADLPVTYALGGHPPSLLDEVDIVFVSPGVPLEIPFLVEARRRGLPTSSETRLFTRLCPAPIVGITGSSGKTTTTAVLGRMFETAGHQTWVGGNIGRPLIQMLDQIEPTDAVVMELSSFQLEFFAPWPQPGREHRSTKPGLAGLFDPAGWSPPIAALLNVTPNHLDRHTTMHAYIAAKAHILNYQESGDTVVLNWDNSVTRELGTGALRQHVLWFSMEDQVREGAFLRGDALQVRLAGRERGICRTGDLQIPGWHNVANMLAACALAGAAGIPIDAIRHTATIFHGVEHRLELVRVRGGVRWYNDSIATTPERTVAALRSFQDPIVLLAGGRDKHLPWDDMATLSCRRVRHLILFGEAAGLIEAAMSRIQKEGHAPDAAGCHIHHAGDVAHAVELASELARPGDIVLLSPGGTSFDAYRDFVARGEHFRRLVNELE